MKLNIYDHKEVIKTYEADEYELMFGTVEDMIDAAKLDKIESGTDAEIVMAATNLVTTSMDTVKDLLKDVFDGLTDDEIRHTRVSEIVNVIVDVIRYAISQISLFGGGKKGKN
jgi:hypothetical protein